MVWRKAAVACPVLSPSAPTRGRPALLRDAVEWAEKADAKERREVVGVKVGRKATLAEVLDDQRARCLVVGRCHRRQLAG